MEPQYNIYFAGEILDGHDPAAVRSALGKLFKADDATLDRLFSGKLQLIKRECDKTTALKYKQAMEKAGANPVIRAADAPEATPPPTPPKADTPSAADKIAALAAAPDELAYRQDQAAVPAETSDAAEGNIDIAPAGTDVLRPDERPKTEAVEVDTSSLSVDAAAERLSEESPAPPSAPDTSHLTMGEVGETIPALDKGAAPPVPSTEHLDLAPSGTDFSDCATPEPEAPQLDLSGVDLAPAGSDVLEAQYRDRKKPAAPDTDHLSLED